jgi:hypothetical protein
MARPSELVIGNCYFWPGYYDRDLLVPAVTTLRYLGEDTSGSERFWRFEPWEMDPDQDPGEIVFTDDQLNSIVNLEGLIARLRELSRVDGVSPRIPVSPPIASDAPALQTLGPEIARLIADPAQVSVTITIQFTDDGFSIGRDAGGALAATFFTHPLLDPTEEQKVIAFFAASGAKPKVDYLADKGRTRILEFPLPADGTLIERICRDLLIRIYAMRADDVLRYSRHAANRQ